MSSSAALQQVIDELEARFGAGIVYRLSQARPKAGAIALSTGSLGLDYATGIGGVPRGRISELYGPPSCGKTSLAYHLLANAQVGGGMAAYVDLPQAMDGEAMLAVGVKLDELIVAAPLNTIEALEIAEVLARCRALDAIVLAIPARLPGAGNLRRHLFAALRKLNAALKGSPTAMVFANEQGSPLSPLPFHAGMRIALAPRCALLAPGGELYGLRVRATVERNKLGMPVGSAEIVIRANGGIYHEAELLDLGLAHGLVEVTSLGPAYQGEILGKSHGQALARLGQDAALAGEIAAQLRKQLWPTSATS